MKVLDFPIIRQGTSYTCSCVCVQACLCYYGFDYREEQIRRLMRVERNTKEIHPRKIVRVLKTFKLGTEYKKLTLNDIVWYINRATPVILDLQAWYKTKTKTPDYRKDNDGHYVVAIGYDTNRIIFSDPASFYKTYLSFAELEQRWHDGDSDDWDYDHMGIVVFGKEPVYDHDKIVHMD